MTARSSSSSPTGGERAARPVSRSRECTASPSAATDSPEKWRLIWPFFAILALHAIAIFLFTRGFLLTRTELSASSRCSDVISSPCSTNVNSTSSLPVPGSRSCWTDPAVERIVIVVLDALRFDFVAPSTFFQEKKPWMDRLQVLQKVAARNASSARIFKAIADPPTTSLQRLKGLTTGGLPTFIDVGNSFGAPAIIEDNLIYQLAHNGKRVLMMGDDTWLQLFPHHFPESYPYPSFNVKDLHTVDDGVVNHIFPALYQKDWDVLIAHFLGVDHAGHIFGVDSNPMEKKLDQYNIILEKIIEVLKKQSEPGGLHENTLLLVMGDHGQTLNGDHGGGTSEEVETALFAMSFKDTPQSVESLLDKSSCNRDLDGEIMCISHMQQLDFAVTIGALIGVPFPFGSIGRINPELYALSRGTWDRQRTTKNAGSISDLEEWLQNYANALCINSWQVKRYIDLYSSTSVIGLPYEDLHHVSKLYKQAQDQWENPENATCLFHNDDLCNFLDSSDSFFQRQIDAYSIFLRNVADLARSAWTEFDLVSMSIGLGILLFSLLFQICTFLRIDCLYRSYQPSVDISYDYLTLVYAQFLVAIRAVSFLSNSYILAEGNVANFLLATSGFLNLLCSLRRGKFIKEDVLFLLLNTILSLGLNIGMSKHVVSPSSMNAAPVPAEGIFKEGPFLWLLLVENSHMLLLSIFTLFVYKWLSNISSSKYLKYFLISGTIASYMLIAFHWITENGFIAIHTALQDIGKNLSPKAVYALGFGQLILLVIFRFYCHSGSSSSYFDVASFRSAAMLSTWSPVLLLLSGRQGPFVAIVCLLGAWCIIKTQKIARRGEADGDTHDSNIDLMAVTQWNLLAVCLFFFSGHWCAFDGLRYGAAFVGFDNFNIIRQGLLLTMDTFGVSHILPILGLPLLITLQHRCSKSSQTKDNLLLKLTRVFLSYGFISTVTTMLTIICVTIQRRHLMVWGLFAPKYVFDVVGLIITDVLICLASIYYYD